MDIKDLKNNIKSSPLWEDLKSWLIEYKKSINDIESTGGRLELMEKQFHQVEALSSLIADIEHETVVKDEDDEKPLIKSLEE